MNKTGLGKIGWLIILLIPFLLINWVGIYLYNQDNPSIKQWIGIILGALLEEILFGVILYKKK